MRATGLGPMPGTDYAEAVKTVLGSTPDLAAVPVLPARGVEAGAVGRTLTVLDDLAADLQPAGWRLADHPGVDARRATSLLARDLETLEDHAQGFGGAVKEQIVGPWTLAARVDLPRGEKVLSDRGARRDLAESLAVGLSSHLLTLRRRLGETPFIVQVDEPGLPDVLGARVRTASGYGRYRSIEPSEAHAQLRPVVEAILAGGAIPAISVPGDAPVGLLTGVGFRAVTATSRTPATDEWAEALERGTELWLGAVDPTGPGEETAARRVARDLISRLGFAVADIADRLVITPSSGLEHIPPTAARQTLETAARMAADRLGE